MITKLASVAAFLALTFGLMIIAQPAEAARFPRWESRTVYVQSTLGKGWDVRRVAEAWDNRSRLNLVYVKRCPADKPCIKFLSGDTNGRLGVARKWLLRGEIVRCGIVISKSLIKKYRVKRIATLSHELGHCLGFDHSHSKRDVMYPVGIPKPWKPSTKHYDRLARTYGR